MGFVACGGYVGGSDVIRGFYFPEVGERLGQLSVAVNHGPSALVEDIGACGEGHATDGAKASGGGADKLGVCKFEEAAVVVEHWEVGAAGEIFGVLFFFDLELRNAHNVIVLQSHIDGFFERDMTWRGRFSFLREGRCGKCWR